MSDRDLMRATVLARVVRGDLTSADGADLLALSVRDEGLWGRKRMWKRRFVRRERKAHFGELVQMNPTAAGGRLLMADLSGGLDD